MKLSDVMKGSKIKIHASINGHGILLITKAAIGVRDGLLVESLTYFDHDLTFREPCKIVAVNKRDGRSYQFESQSIGPVETKYGKFHLIRCPEDGIVMNRRQAERYDIDKLGVIRIGNKGDIRNALVYDISMKGIAFILDNDAICKVGDHITASFRYDPNYFHFYACEATVVRVFTIENQLAIGCTLDSMGADLVTLISNKKKEKAGIKINDILNISESSDSAIASGDKIPVNYVPPTQNSSAAKAASSAPLPAPAKAPATPAAHEEDGTAMNLFEQLLSPDAAADLIPERKESDIMKSRAERVADIADIPELEGIREGRAPIPSSKAEHPTASPIEQLVDLNDLAELQSIEDRTPAKQKAAQKPAPAPAKKQASSYDPARSLANAANADNAKVHLKNAASSDFDGYFNQKGNAVDESLFIKGKKEDGFLTPEQIADIIDLERINKSDF
ncbi:PilZ domain-containing protein [Butyrivibrio sp. AE3006]|uniref:PilZ domain-containing protein n=1 Tax=Butyrivibrio sp. AE3006 TaxID=1280673 RepID=UPI00055C6C25|nr:PilZ domain-containing protein [Butyrivibrio sp. AE3006]